MYVTHHLIVPTGGQTEAQETLHTSEIYNDNSGGFLPGSNLKDNVGRYSACMARLNSNSFIITGGAAHDPAKKFSMIRHDIDPGTWTDLKDRSIDREVFACGHLNGEKPHPSLHKIVLKN